MRDGSGGSWTRVNAMFLMAIRPEMPMIPHEGPDEGMTVSHIERHAGLWER